MDWIVLTRMALQVHPLFWPHLVVNYLRLVRRLQDEAVRGHHLNGVVGQIRCYPNGWLELVTWEEAEAPPTLADDVARWQRFCAPRAATALPAPITEPVQQADDAHRFLMGLEAAQAAFQAFLNPPVLILWAPALANPPACMTGKTSLSCGVPSLHPP